jgi:hypothetical protein
MTGGSERQDETKVIPLLFFVLNVKSNETDTI